ncbi:MAG: hypothetical protein WA183_11690 [Chthoniobacterales bacterium]
MSLVKLIDSLIDDIGTGLRAATIRARLLSLREQAEAVEASMKKAQTRVKNLEANMQTQKVAPDQGRLEKGAEKLLQILSRSHRPSLEQAARELGIKQIVAEHHANKLSDAGMIEISGFVPGKGTMYGLTPKGTAYVVENKLAE